jgi:ribosomal protein L37E
MKKIVKNPCKRCGSRSYRFQKKKNLSYCTICGLEKKPEEIAKK